ncbi:hypothetical protein [uncultured Helicobacter sp.]|uniref:hypothetical protein n=1 Tax=uncultured Helicobacter sp. TaxID=175537 RepID=UPI00374F6CF6
MKKILTTFVFLFSLGVLASVAFIVYQKTNLIKPPFVASKLTDDIQTTEIEHNDMWLKDFSVSSNDSFQYPATELFVKFDFAKNPQDNAIRSIEIKDLDEYKYFCVAQVLKQNKLESTYYKSGDVLRLMVFIDNDAVLQKFLQDLQYYRIQYILK